MLTVTHIVTTHRYTWGRALADECAVTRGPPGLECCLEWSSEELTGMIAGVE